jgi:hypothetical protein
MTAQHPWRKVTRAMQRTGRGSLLGPDTWRRARWWDLFLECGHVVQRSARYVPAHDRVRRSWHQALGPPKRVRCGECPP